MNTTLNPPPTDREREMLAEWASVWIPIAVAQDQLDPIQCAMEWAEYILTAFRSRYGVTGEATHTCRHCGVETTQPDSECYKAPAPSDITITIYQDGSGCMMNVHDAEYSYFNSIPELITILKGGNNG